MKVQIEPAAAVSAQVDALVFLVCEGEAQLGGALGQVDERLGGALREALARGELKGRPNETLLVHTLGRLPAPRVLLVGLGKRTEAGARQVGQAGGTAARYLRGRGARRLGLSLGAGLSVDRVAAARAVVRGATLALYDADTYRTEGRETGAIDELLLLDADPAWLPQVEEELCLAEATNRIRELINRPANEMTPRLLAEEAGRIAEEGGLGLEVLDEEAMAQRGMRALLGVAAGSAEPARLIALRYEPPGTPPSPCLAVVGKGITFDSGGISIKPAANMHRMKYDMSGGAAVLGAMSVIAQLRPPLRVLGVVPATENMPGGRALKPGDVIRTMSGKTIEILNTDAEGRVVLSDALAYAVQAGATHIVDLATLTGGCVVALGKVASGVMGRPESWVHHVLDAAARAGEQMWPLPLFPEYKEQIKSAIADIANSGGREASPITGALFIGEFAAGRPWAHLDIAGTAWNDRELPYLAPGPTGVGVATLVHLATTGVE